MSEQKSFREKVEAFDGAYPPAWIPEPGQTLFGYVHQYDVVPTKFSPNSIAMQVVDEVTGEIVTVWILSVVLQSKFRKLRPLPGERIAIKYLGKVEDRMSGAPYHNYGVFVDRVPEQSTPWDNEPKQVTAPVQAAPAAVAPVGETGSDYDPFAEQ